MRHLRLILVIAVLVNVALVGWLLARRPAGHTPQPLASAVAPLLRDTTMASTAYDLRARARELNLIVVSMDALRYDRTGFSGNDKGLTPNLDALARESVVFHDAVAAASWTLPSHMSLFTGRWPSVHRVTNKLVPLGNDQLGGASLSPAIETFPDRLIRAGWVAAGFTGGAGVQAAFGFGRGFETYVDDKNFAGLDYSAPKAAAWVKARGDRPFFLFLHGYDSHGMYELKPPPRTQITEYRGSLDGTSAEQARLREQGLAMIQAPGDRADITAALGPADGRFLADVYDRKVKGADERLGAFLTQLKSQGLLDRSVLVVLSDHGDEFLEHGHIDHGHTLYQEQLHAVLLMRFPGYGRQQDVREPVRLVDVFPTLFDALGLEGPPGVDGRSLLPLLRGSKDPVLDALFAETDYRLFVHHRMVREGAYKLILDLGNGRKQLFNLKEDPQEQRDIASQEPRVTYEMEQSIRAWMDQARTNPQDYLGLKQRPIELF